MPETITAVYENGVFRPLSAVSFQDGETLQINIVRDVSPEALKDDRELAIKLMDKRGLIRWPNKQTQINPAELALREKNWRELFEKLKGRPGTPVSEIVIEDRGPW
jgi:predicted DNA-binding antitoxin AbrB/MazE fold protein